jgi:hypothetical protein
MPNAGEKTAGFTDRLKGPSDDQNVDTRVPLAQ